jgi:hypothetical protein
VPFAVGINRSPGEPGEVEQVRERLGLGLEVPVMPCDATDKASVKELLLALLYAVLDDVEAESAQAAGG